ncbi:MAG: hypothetical protein ABIN91_05290 [Mucilaginibacter sp.]|uniref:hypothetical protein n=1 Tax=Mucilaginibacter sp. TaxID=1882438 RepID=UPI0032662810
MLKIRDRKANALNGTQFSASISDTSINLKHRENIIYKAIRKGNVPAFYRQLVLIKDTLKITGVTNTINYYVLPDYLAVGTDSNYFYCPMTPALAQRVANKLKCSLLTRKMVNDVYRDAAIKLSPLPIPPTSAMTTVAVFEKHNQMLIHQKDSLGTNYIPGMLTAGNKKDVIISNRIYNDTSAYHIVIYGWHKKNGKAIQPLYARHIGSWADYSHGIRLSQRKICVNGKKTSIKKVLRSEYFNVLLSDEGVIKKPFYPTD